ncbi:hypothetical protein HNO89_003432 [Sporosarcina luteola]|nr:hypothetical protein [Sporosarcina luteola]
MNKLELNNFSISRKESKIESAGFQIEVAKLSKQRESQPVHSCVSNIAFSRGFLSDQQLSRFSSIDPFVL